MTDQPTSPVRPLYFLASYPRSGGNWLREAVFLLVALSQPNPPKRIDLRGLDRVIPFDIDARIYAEVTGKDAEALTEEDVAAARPQVHEWIARNRENFPVTRTHAVRGTFHGHPTFNTKVSTGGTYVVRNPLEVAASLVAVTGRQPMQVIQVMMTADRRVRPRKDLVVEPQGSWSQNVASWAGKPQPEVNVIRFEDLKADPAKVFKTLAAHMRIPADAKAVERAVGLLAETQKKRVRELGPRDYRETLQPVHARAIIEAHGMQMDAQGYLTDAVLKYADIDRKAALTLAQKHAPRTVN